MFLLNPIFNLYGIIRKSVDYDDIMDFITQISAYTDLHGVVDQDRFNDGVKELIFSNGRHRGWYMEYGESIWNKKKHSRLDTNPGHSDNYGY